MQCVSVPYCFLGTSEEFLEAVEYSQCIKTVLTNIFWEYWHNFLFSLSLPHLPFYLYSKLKVCLNIGDRKMCKSKSIIFFSSTLQLIPFWRNTTRYHLASWPNEMSSLNEIIDFTC